MDILASRLLWPYAAYYFLYDHRRLPLSDPFRTCTQALPNETPTTTHNNDCSNTNQQDCPPLKTVAAGLVRFCCSYIVSIERNGGFREHPKETPLSATLLPNSNITILAPTCAPRIADLPVWRVCFVIVSNQHNSVVKTSHCLARAVIVVRYDSTPVARKETTVALQHDGDWLNGHGRLHTLFSFFKTEVVACREDNLGFPQKDGCIKSFGKVSRAGRRTSLTVGVWIVIERRDSTYLIIPVKVRVSPDIIARVKLQKRKERGPLEI